MQVPLDKSFWKPEISIIKLLDVLCYPIRSSLFDLIWVSNSYLIVKHQKCFKYQYPGNSPQQVSKWYQGRKATFYDKKKSGSDE